MKLSKKEKRKLKMKKRKEKRLRLKLAKQPVETEYETPIEIKERVRGLEPVEEIKPPQDISEELATEEEIIKRVEEEMKPEPLEERLSTGKEIKEFEKDITKVGEPTTETKTKNMNILKGKLTYAMAAIAILWGIIGWIAGWIEAEIALAIIWGGLTTFGIRRAIK